MVVAWKSCHKSNCNFINYCAECQAIVRLPKRWWYMPKQNAVNPCIFPFYYSYEFFHCNSGTWFFEPLPEFMKYPGEFFRNDGSSEVGFHNQSPGPTQVGCQGGIKVKCGTYSRTWMPSFFRGAMCCRMRNRAEGVFFPDVRAATLIIVFLYYLVEPIKSVF